MENNETTDIFRLYIAEYEQIDSWTIGNVSNILKYIKPYDMYLVYETGRFRLPNDSNKIILTRMGTQCKFFDATQMSDNDLRTHMVEQIKIYATENTYVYFLRNEEDFAAVEPEVKDIVKEVSCKTHYRTGSIKVPSAQELDIPNAGAQEIMADAGSPHVVIDNSDSQITASSTVVTEPVIENSSQSDEGEKQQVIKENAPNDPDSTHPEHSGSKRSRRNRNRRKNKNAQPKEGTEFLPKTEGADEIEHKEIDPAPEDAAENTVNNAPQQQNITESEKKPAESKTNPVPAEKTIGMDMSTAMFASAFFGKIGDASQRAPGSVPTVSKKTKNSDGTKNKSKAEPPQNHASAERKGEDAPNHRQNGSNNETAASSDPINQKESCKEEEKLPKQSELDHSGENRDNSSPPVQEEQEKTAPSPNAPPASDDGSSNNQNPKEEKNDPENQNKSWAQRNFATQPEQNTPKQTESRLYDLERSIFGAKQAPTEVEVHYTPLDDSKAQTVSLLADRMIEDIELLIRDIKKHELDYDKYMELVSTLIRSTSLDDFKNGWGIVCPGCDFTIDKKIYLMLRKQALHYAKACSVLYSEDDWG